MRRPMLNAKWASPLANHEGKFPLHLLHSPFRNTQHSCKFFCIKIRALSKKNNNGRCCSLWFIFHEERRTS